MTDEEIKKLASAVVDELQRRDAVPRAVGATTRGTVVMSDGTERLSREVVYANNGGGGGSASYDAPVRHKGN